MQTTGDVLGDEGRKALDACVKVKIYGKPETTRYLWDTAVGRIRGCYAYNIPVGVLVGANRWYGDGWLRPVEYLMIPTEVDKERNPNREITYDIIDIHDALANFDELPYVEKYPKLGAPRYDELKGFIDERRADVERECKEATANPDGRRRYSWLVAQRRVRDCFTGNFAGDMALLENEPDPNELHNIIEIYDAVKRYDEQRLLEKYPRESPSPEERKQIDAQRAGIEVEYKKAISADDKDVIEYSLWEAERRLMLCYKYDEFGFRSIWYHYQSILPIKTDETGNPKTTQTCNIFDIHKALHCLDEKMVLQKYPDEGPGCDELKKSIKKHSFDVEREYRETKCKLHRYSWSDAEQRVRDCFESTLLEDVEIFSIKEGANSEPNSQTFDIIDIYKRLLHFEKVKKGFQLRSHWYRPSLHLEVKCREAVRVEYLETNKRLHRYSRSEAERRVRNCFVGTKERDADIFLPHYESWKQMFCHTPRTYDIFEIKKAVDHFDVKKLLDKYPEQPGSDEKKRLVDEQRAQIEREYVEATTKIEIEHGSGFIIHDHFVITNKHVVEDALYDETKEICISSESTGELLCEVADCDAGKDLALLYCQELNGISPLQLSNQSLLPGMQVFCFGFPMSHKGERALFVNGHVSGSKEMYSGHTMVVLNCSLNSGNSGGPVLCWVKEELKVVGVATQKHFKEILTLEERETIEKIRESLLTSAITAVSDCDLKNATIKRNLSLCAMKDPCQMPINLLTLKLYDALETHSQFNLSNALPGHCVVEFIKETISKCKRADKEKLTEVVKWSEDRVNILS